LKESEGKNHEKRNGGTQAESPSLVLQVGGNGREKGNRQESLFEMGELWVAKAHAFERKVKWLKTLRKTVWKRSFSLFPTPARAGLKNFLLQRIE
jgi:hypothetical protein